MERRGEAVVGGGGRGSLGLVIMVCPTKALPWLFYFSVIRINIL